PARRRRPRRLGTRCARGRGHSRCDAHRPGAQRRNPRRRRRPGTRSLSPARRRHRDRCRRARLPRPLNRSRKVEMARSIAYMRAMRQADAAPMPIAGHIDPVPVPRPAPVRADGRIDLVGLSRSRIRAVLEAAGMEPRQARLRAKQLWHWIYNRGVTDLSAMTDIAKVQHPWLAERFVVGRPEVVVEQVSTDGTRKWLLRTLDGHDFEMVFIP